MTEADFLQTIYDYPDDLLPRLAFADCLEERGHGDRAEFIRVQCELAKYNGVVCGCDGSYDDGCPACDKEHPLRRRERELLAVYEKEWRGCPLDRTEVMGHWLSGRETQPLQYSDGGSSVFEINCEFRCGFVEHVSCTAEQWRQHGPEIVRAAPVREVRLTDREPEENRNDLSIYWFETRRAFAIDHPLDGQPHHVPPEWYSLLSGFKNGRIAAYQTAEAALADLSRACVRWARAETRDGQLRKMPEWTPATAER